MSVLLARDEENNKSVLKTSLNNANPLHKSKTELITSKDKKVKSIAKFFEVFLFIYLLINITDFKRL